MDLGPSQQDLFVSLTLGDRKLLPTEVAQLFGRPYMGGLERKGVIATGSTAAIRAAVRRVLAQAPERFILAADCTVPSDTPWDNLKTAIDAWQAFQPQHLLQPQLCCIPSWTPSASDLPVGKRKSTPAGVLFQLAFHATFERPWACFPRA